MKRRLLTSASILSLLLSAAMCALWARSCFHQDAVERFVIQQYATAEWDIDDAVYSARGRILWVHDRHADLYGSPTWQEVRWHWHNPILPEEDIEPDRNPLSLLNSARGRSSLGFATDLGTRRDVLREQWANKGFYLIVPQGILAALFALPPAMLAIHRLRKRRRVAIPECGKSREDAKARRKTAKTQRRKEDAKKP